MLLIFFFHFIPTEKSAAEKIHRKPNLVKLKTFSSSFKFPIFYQFA